MKASKYIFRRSAHTGGDYRLDCIASTGDNAAFEKLRGKLGRGRGRLYVNVNPQGFGREPGGKQGIRLTTLTHSKNITAVYQPDRSSNLAFGDYCEDALIFDTSGFKLDKFGKPEPGCELAMYAIPGERVSACKLYMKLLSGRATFDNFEMGTVREEYTETVTQGELFSERTLAISNHYSYE